MRLGKQLFLFAVVGGIGFVVDVGVLYLLKGAIGNYWGRGASFLAAVLSTWVLNKRLTFREYESGLSTVSELLRYAGLMLGGGAVNYLVYALLVRFSDQIATQPVWGVAAGSIAGMLVNFWLSKSFLFISTRA